MRDALVTIYFLALFTAALVWAVRAGNPLAQDGGAWDASSTTVPPAVPY